MSEKLLPELLADLRAIRYLAENGSQDRPTHKRLETIAEYANAALKRIDAAIQNRAAAKESQV